MWAIRVLAGPTVGQTFPLKQGLNIVGRHPTCQVVLPLLGISKNHAQIIVTEDKIILEDLQSRNGTFINGVRITHQRLKANDKIKIHDAVLEVMLIDEMALLNAPRPTYAPALIQEPTNLLSPIMASPQSAGAQQGENSAGPIRNAQKAFHHYVDDVALPGVYRLTEMFEFKYVVMGFVFAFILIVTAFAIVPMSSLTKENIQKESQRRALTIAKNLAMLNRKQVLDDMAISLNTRMAEVEPGVKEALIISATKGVILAPASQAGNVADSPFVHRARHTQEEMIEQISDSEIGASVPISSFNPEVGAPVAEAYAVVIYNIDEMAGDFSRILSLFIQTFIAACAVGSLLYFILIRMIQQPFDTLNRQMDEILQSGGGELRVPFKDFSIQALISNLNSAISRMGSQEGAPTQSDASLREVEAQALVRMMGWPCLAVSALDDKIIAANEAFYHLQSSHQNLEKETLDSLSDPALKESCKDLISQFNKTHEVTLHHELPSQGSETYEITAQRVLGRHDTAYYLISIVIQGEQAA